jgi:hypothetical protein
MWRRTSISAVVASVTLAAAAGAQGHGRMGMMGMGRDSATMAQMRVIHELFVNNTRIERSVTNLPNGIRTVTTSADSALARLIKDHVLTMDQRVTRGDDPRLPMESEALRTIFRGKDRIRTVIDSTTSGVIVVQTSSDSSIVAALQQHAAEVSDFVRRGMPAMREAMMRNMHGAVRAPHERHDTAGRVP